MNWPATLEQMTAAGWALRGRSNCRGCGRGIRWARGPESKTSMPLEVAGGFYRPHFASCPKASEFRRRDDAPPKNQGSLF